MVEGEFSLQVPFILQGESKEPDGAEALAASFNPCVPLLLIQGGQRDEFSSAPTSHCLGKDHVPPARPPDCSPRKRAGH